MADLSIVSQQPIQSGLSIVSQDPIAASPFGGGQSRGAGYGGSWEEESPLKRFGRGAIDAVDGVLKAGALGVSNEAVPKGHGPESLGEIKDELVNFVKGFAAQKEVDEGDYAAAAGKILTNLAMLRSAKGAADGEVGVSDPVAKPNPVDVRQRVADAARTASQAVNPDIVGIFSPRAAHLQRAIGRAANAIEPDAVAPVPAHVPYGQGTRNIKLADIANVPQGPTAPAESTSFAQIPKPQQPQGFSWQSFKVGKVEGEPTPQPTTSTRTESVQPAQPVQDNAADLAKALGFKSAQQAETRYGSESWNKMVTGNQVVDAAVPSQGPTAKLNTATKQVVAESIAKGDVSKAATALEVAAKESKLRWEDFDVTKLRADLEEEGVAIERYKQRINRAKSSADHNKGSLMSAAEVVDSMPAPYGTMEFNKFLGYEGRRTIEEATQARKDAMQPQQELDAPWGGNVGRTPAPDLTTILLQSLDQAKRKQGRKPRQSR